jgi:hypothetical protein
VFVAASEPTNKKISKCLSDDVKDSGKYSFMEQDNISRVAGRVVRNGLRLELHTGKRVVVLKDDCSDGETHVRYSFDRHLTDIGYFLVNVTAYEGSGFLLINDHNGKQFFISGKPLVSPDKKRILITSMDYMAGYSNKTIELWRLTLTGLEEEYVYDTLNERACGASDARWLDNKSVEFTLECAVSDTSDLTTTTKARLIMKKEKWNLLKL